MATAAVERTRCRCGQFLRRRPDADSYADTEREYVDEYQDDHECAAGLYGPDRRLDVDSIVEAGGVMDARELRLIGLKELAHWLGVQEQTTRQWRLRKQLPPAAELATGPVWTEETIERYGEQNPTGPVGQALRRLKDKGEQA